MKKKLSIVGVGDKMELKEGMYVRTNKRMKYEAE